MTNTASSEERLQKSNALRLKLAMALATILKSTSLEQVRITALCEIAGVSRTTFYNLFDNIDDLCLWTIHNVAQHGLEDIGRTMSWEEGYYLFFQRVLDVRELYVALSTHATRDYYQQHAIEKRYETLVESVRMRTGSKPFTKEKLEIRQFVEAETMVVMNWMTSKMSAPIGSLVTTIISMVPRHLYEALEI